MVGHPLTCQTFNNYDSVWGKGGVCAMYYVYYPYLRKFALLMVIEFLLLWLVFGLFPGIEVKTEKHFRSKFFIRSINQIGSITIE